MNYIFELNHPKHYYQFKYIMLQLQKDGHNVKVLARDKDVLLKVLEQEGVAYKIFGLHQKKMMKKVLGTPKLIWNYLRIARSYHPDVIVSKASFYGVMVAKLVGAKSVIFPDSEVVKVTNKYVVPLATKVITPGCFALDFGKKHQRIKGIFEDCYLAPNLVEDARGVVKELKQPYAILRFVGWYANHDTTNSGLTLDEKNELIKAIEPYMTVYISSEKPLPPELESYRLPTPANQIHSVLLNADLYIGDSQTMAAEAALLGAPAIRSNTFVGPHDMTNFKVLENQYGLLCNIRDFNEVMSVAKDFAEHSHKTAWMKKRQAYFNHVGDSNAEITKMLEEI